MPGYTQLTQEQRYQIYALRKAGFNQSLIAAELAVHKSTITRELKRNTGQRGYRPQQASQAAKIAVAVAPPSNRSHRLVAPLVVPAITSTGAAPTHANNKSRAP